MTMNHTRKNSIHCANANFGFGVIELMIALVISMFLLAAVSAVYMSTKQTFNTSNNVARIQENSRFALHFMNQDLRMAGFAGCTRNINSVLDTTASAYDSNLYDPNQVVGGWEFAGTAPGDTYALTTLDPASASAGSWTGMGASAFLHADLSSRNLVPGSDVLVVKRANTPLAVRFDTSWGPSGDEFDIRDGRPVDPANTSKRLPPIDQFDLLVLSNCQQADLIQNTDSNPDSTGKLGRVAGTGVPGNFNPVSNPLSQAYDDATDIYAFTSQAYFIAPGNDGNPSLFRLSFSSGQPAAGEEQELVEGVENMQVLYGEDTTGDGVANKYITADDVVDPAQIVAVRIGLLMRAVSHNEDFIDESQKQFFIADNIEVQPIVDPNHLRYVASSTIQLRNLGL